MTVRIALLLVVTCFCSQLIFAQKSIVFPAEVLSASCNEKAGYMAVTTPDSIYIISTDSCTVRQRRAHGLRLPSVYGFHPQYSDLVFLREYTQPVQSYTTGTRASMYRWESNEYPNDSIVFFNPNKTDVQKFAGNNHFIFGQKENQLLFVVNKVLFPNGNEAQFSAGTCELQTRDGDYNFTSQPGKACRRLIVNNDFSLAAAAWYKTSSEGRSFSFSLFNARTHQPVVEMDSLYQLPAAFCFSPDNRFAAVALSTTKTKEAFIAIIDPATRTIVHRFAVPGNPGSDQVSNLCFSAGSDAIQFTAEGSWYSWSLAEKRMTQNVWANLTHLFSIQDAIALKDQLWVCGDAADAQNGTRKKYGTIDILSMSDLAIFTRIGAGTTTSYADSLSYTMMLNDIQQTNGNLALHFNPSKEYFTLVAANRLQLWETKKRKKVFEYGFSKKIVARPDASGSFVLIREEKGNSRFDQYTLHIAQLGNSTLVTSSVLEGGKDAPDANDYNFDCIADPSQPNTWLCVDGEDKLWQIKGDGFSIQPLATWLGMKATRLVAGPQGQLYVQGSFRNESAIWKCNKDGSLEKAATAHGGERFVVLNDEVWVWSEKAGQVKRWKKGAETGAFPVPGNLHQLDINADHSQVLLTYGKKESSRTFLQITDGTGIATTDSINKLYARLWLLNNDAVLYADNNDGLITYTKGYPVAWASQTPAAFLSSFGASADGKQLQFGSTLLNLQDLSSTQLPYYSTFAVLPDHSGIVQLNTHSYKYNPSDKLGFDIMRIDRRTGDTTKSKTFISAPDNLALYEMMHNHIVVSPDGKYAVTYGADLIGVSEKNMYPALAWNLQTMKAVPMSVRKVYRTSFIGNGLIAMYTADSLAIARNRVKRIYDLATGTAVDTLAPRWEDYVSYPGAGISIQSQAIALERKTGNNIVADKSFYAREYLSSALYYAASSRIIAGSANGNIIIWDSKGSATPVKTIATHTAAIERMLLRGNRLYALSAHGDIMIVDMSSEKLLMTIKLLQKDKELRFAMITPDGYYRIDPDLVNDFHFVQNGRVYPLSSFELQGNRPDKVFAALGYTDTVFLNNLSAVWKARVQKAGFDPDKLKTTANRPLVKWEKQQLPVVTGDSLLQLRLQVSDSRTELQSLLIRVNGVPEISSKGLPLEKKKTTGLVYNLPLCSGQNNISIIAVNSLGEESVEETATVYYTPAKTGTARVYYIGVGVSDYADKTKNLRYAAKDVRDIARQLARDKDAIILDTLLSSQATQQAILGIKEKLLHTNIDDIVILSFSGHGMLQKETGFVFAPYDMDFANPAKKGVSIAAMENLLDGIPARKKLLLLDACHSGEDIAATNKQGLPPGVTVNNRGTVVESTDSLAAQPGRNKQLLMQELFGDLSRGNGAFVISAAAGNEYAFEGAEWKNGVFTYSFLQSLLYGSHRIPVRKLRAAIYDKVSQLTNGQQTPASRRENGWWNWEL